MYINPKITVTHDIIESQKLMVFYKIVLYTFIIMS